MYKTITTKWFIINILGTCAKSSRSCINLILIIIRRQSLTRLYLNEKNDKTTNSILIIKYRIKL